jgi:hypothetical protein
MVLGTFLKRGRLIKYVSMRYVVKNGQTNVLSGNFRVEDGLERGDDLSPVHFQHVPLGRPGKENERLKLNVMYQLLLFAGHANLFA